MQTDRDLVVERLALDLIGPKDGENEIINERPSDRYLTGILFPKNLVVKEDDQADEDAAESKGNQADTSQDRGVALFRSIRPATMGVSFAVVSANGHPKIRAQVTCAKYSKVEELPDTRQSGNEVDSGAQQSKRTRKGDASWKRLPLLGEISINLDRPIQFHSLANHGVKGLSIYVKTTKLAGRLTVTVQIINDHEVPHTDGRDALELGTFFQAALTVKCGEGTSFMPRPVRSFAGDPEAKSTALIFRQAKEFATGHSCSAAWTEDNDGTISSVHGTWMPRFEVKPMDPDGDEIFAEYVGITKAGVLSATKMASASKEDLIELLNAVLQAYRKWVDHQSARIADLEEEYHDQARANIESCAEGADRIASGIELLEKSPDALLAFQLANRAMALQRQWQDKKIDKPEELSDLVWRPFQIAFALLTLPSVAARSHPDRSVLDLIWFPTGGGKTEAYLLVTAFCLFMRRLRKPGSKEGLGLGVFMRYTLRTLTVQQFQRAAALISACEEIRTSPQGRRLGTHRFSIGLWVGDDSTPNTFVAAKEALASKGQSTPAQVTQCPKCKFAKVKLIWKAHDDTNTITCECPADQCRSADSLGVLPILTLDEQIYRDPPSLLIGTVDKFAQIVRRKESAALFGRPFGYSPPDLIIQDELHLISGPLGTITGLYEIAVDALCTTNEGPPKIIGSTATIRRAAEQVNALFGRESFTFPPAALDESNSAFAKKTPDAAGRLYLGLTTAGRSDKFVLQAVAASLLQAGTDPRLSPEGRDAYATLVAYFNSLKILGGALVSMQDDVPKTIAAIAPHRAEKARKLDEPEELTSRKASSEIPKILEQLDVGFGKEGFIDILLASNMLSVGVDIPRLGLMVVNGQPKSMSEYIQATSRVGRSKKGPGLVVTLYNNTKIRDRAHYETFTTWHSALYRSVEPTSVTPFAPRARDKALHAPLVAMAIHLLGAGARLTEKQASDIEKVLIPIILKRVQRVDARELAATEEELRSFLAQWADRTDLTHLWNDAAFNKSLLISAEKSAARRAAGKGSTPARATPNSVRNVEPSVDYILRDFVPRNPIAPQQPVGEPADAG
jgi:hypothetical protein